MTFNNFGYAYVLANELFGIEINPDQFEEIGLVAFGMIGNNRTRIHRTTLDVDCDTGSVELPCEAD
jgi:hypothetical protein